MLIRADSEAVLHGLGLFETILAIDGRAVLAEEHFERLASSASVLGFPPPARAAFDDAIAPLLAGQTGEQAIRCTYIAAEGWQLFASTGPIPPATRSRRELGRAILLDRSFSRALPQHKLTSYAPCIIALRRAQDAGADEALFVAADGGILEGTSTNVFAVAGDRLGDRLITAPVSAGILPGVTRTWVLRTARTLGIDVEERVPTLDELHRGSFFTGSLTTIAAIRFIDGAPCDAAAPVMAALADRWTSVAL